MENKKLEKILKKAEHLYKEAKDDGVTDWEKATYLKLEAIYYQNQAMIKLLKDYSKDNK